MARRRLVAVCTFLALMSFPSLAQAGGWAITSFDSLPADFEAGKPYDLTYTILQHGQTPVDVGTSVVQIRDSRGAVTEFEAVPTGEVGRYTVTVTFPAAGSFTWGVTQGGFEAYQLGTIEVSAAATAAVAASGGLLRWLLPTLLALVIGLIAVQVMSLVRNRRVPAWPESAD